MNVADLNIALAKALGITCTDHLHKVELVIEAGQLPKVTAHFHVKHADGLHAVVQQSRLVPVGTAAEAAGAQQEARDAA